MKLLRKIAIVFVPIYYIVTRLRNLLYDLRLLPSTSYDFPVLAVGNLSVGGTGKTPMVEYLIRLLNDKKQLAILSRGYGRKTTEFQWVDVDDHVSDVGDEPLQYKRKFVALNVAVDTDRNNGIEQLRAAIMPPEVVLLDDAFQHRKVQAGMYILLTTHDQLYVNDQLLPTGNLRESKRAAKRATIVVVTKCPEGLTEMDQQQIAQKLNLTKKQSLFFSKITYDKKLKSKNNSKSLAMFNGVEFSLVTGIADAAPLVRYFQEEGFDFDHLEYPDHHDFSKEDLQFLKKLPMVITTEKDYVRLASSWPTPDTLWYQPMEMQFISNSAQFDAKIIDFAGLGKE